MGIQLKSFVCSLFLLFFLICIILYASHVFLHNALIDQLSNRSKNNLRLVETLIRSSSVQLEKTLNGLVLNSDFYVATNNMDTIFIEQYLELYWKKLKLNNKLDSFGLHYFLASYQVILGRQDFPEDLVVKAFQQEVPQREILCFSECHYYLALPVFMGDEKVFILTASVPVYNALINFKEISQTDFILTSSEKSDQENLIVPWGLSILAVTNRDFVLELIKEISSQIELSDLAKGVIFKKEQHRYFVRSENFSYANDSSATFIFLDSVGFELLSYEKIFTIIMVGLFVCGATLILFFLFFLSNPFRKIKLVCSAMTGLSDFEKGKEVLSSIAVNEKVKDEADCLIDSAIGYFDYLNSINNQLGDKIKLFEEKNKELEQEKDFTTCLLDASRALILTQDSRCKVEMVNKHGLSLLGKIESTVLNRCFTTLLSYESQLPDLRFQLDELTKGVKSFLSHESRLKRYDGKFVYMTWFHSRLPKKDQYGYYILTIGLDVSYKKKTEDHLGWLASHDSLTGLVNRRSFTDSFKEILSSSSKYDVSGVLLFLDLDQFKDVNDSSGHHVGDDVLKRVARILRKYSDEERDVISRFGGDEFAMVLGNADKFRAIDVSEKICKALVNMGVPGSDNSHRISASIGIVQFPEHGDTISGLLANADLAMYHAKESGGNGWHFFQLDEQSWDKVKERVYWNEMVKYALEKDAFEVHFQPILNLKTQDISHYEALLRVYEYSNNPIASQKFILSAENSGTIQELDQRIVGRVFKIKSELEKRGIHPRVAINLSGLSFKNENLYQYVSDLSDEFKIRTSEIIFEITETAAVSDSNKTKEIMDKIKKLGCQFSLDDFGVGFSSLYYLKKFPFDYVKIDGNFIKNITEDMDDQVMVKALVEVANSFGQYTIAEFVETEDALNLLKMLDVNYAQGYFVGKPMPWTEVWPLGTCTK